MVTIRQGGLFSPSSALGVILGGMDCPACGLVHPPDAERCDCGFDFATGEPSGLPGWAIDLAWRQKLAAFWAISWPAWLGNFIVVIVLASGVSVSSLEANASSYALAGNLVFFALQAPFTCRLVRKNYRSFRIYVVRGGAHPSRDLTHREAVPVWLWIVWPQAMFFLLGSLTVWLLRTRLAADLLRDIATASLWLRVLVVGPYAVGLALRIQYATFQLQAYGLRYI